MDCHPTDGTSGDGFVLGADLWLARDPRVIYDFDYAFENWAPTERSLREPGQYDGLACFVYGKYVVHDESPGRVEAGARVGGHMVTLRRVSRNGAAFQLESRDPADSTDSWYLQSPFSKHIYDSARLVTVDVHGTSFSRQMIQLVPVANERVRLIDAVVAIRPRAVLTWNPDGGFIATVTPAPFDPAGPVTINYDPLTNALAPMDEVVLAPDWAGVYFSTRSLLQGGTGRLAHLDFATGERTNLLTIGAGGAHLRKGR